MADDATTRPLSEEEERLLDHLLAVDDPRLEPLRQQVQHAVVTDDSQWPRMFELSVPHDAAPPAKNVYGNPAVEAHTIDSSEHGLHVTLWIDGDYLGHVEISWYDTEPQHIPRPDELHPAQRL